MRRCLPVVLWILVSSVVFVGSDKVNPEGNDLLREADTKTNLFELPSFELKAVVRLENKGDPIAGSYILLWNGPEQWREEISLPGYSEVTVGGKGTVSRQRNMDFTPLQIEYLRRALSYGRTRLALGPNETIKTKRARDLNGTKVECLEIVNQENQSREVCIDPSTGVQVRQMPFLDKELSGIDTKLFPRFLSYAENGKTLADVVVTEIKTKPQFSSSTFEPPVGGVSKPGCINPTPGRVVERINPTYPSSERASHVQGTVAIYGVIAADGRLRDLRIVSGVSPALNRSSIDAVRQWRYEPYECDGVPVDVESMVFVNYKLNL